jgi:excinuclease ABC subunit C
MHFDDLKEKALSLPLKPGIYIMKDKNQNVIYVGKAKKLRNRVSNYFQDNVAHSAKTKLMVSRIFEFDVIVVASEFEALVLECSMIKRYMPKYNILLKDDKGYPYIRLDINQPYPVLTIANRIADDRAEYYGPYGSRGTTFGIIKTIKQVLRLPDCKKTFPRDIGKDRYCLNYHMGLCDGWCDGKKDAESYRQVIESARQLLRGEYKAVVRRLREQMSAAADELNFELAASLRDKMNAIESLGQKQTVALAGHADTDAIGYAQTETKACFAVLHFNNGNLIDKEYEILSIPDTPESAVSSLVKQFYLSRGYAPRNVLLPFAVSDSQLFSQLLQQQLNKKCVFKVPQRGDFVRLLDLAQTNAREEVERITNQEERIAAVLALLGKMLVIPPPMRIESYDISNIAGTDIVASMVVFQNGKPLKSAYKHYKIEGLEQQDDYASMKQVLTRRFTRYSDGDKGFSELPDMLLIDGGEQHAVVAVNVLKEFRIDVPVFGMVKDDRHRTRALITPDGREIGIVSQQSIYALIGNIQEETHRFAISYHRNLRSKRLRYSELDKIAGIGPKRKQLLLKVFGSITEISAASPETLKRVLPADAANSVYTHFHPDTQ